MLEIEIVLLVIISICPKAFSSNCEKVLTLQDNKSYIRITFSFLPFLIQKFIEVSQGLLKMLFRKNDLFTEEVSECQIFRRFDHD